MRHRLEFEEHCRLALPDNAALEVAADKLRTLELARALGVPAPMTLLVHDVPDALRAAQALGYPVVLKPRVSRSYASNGELRRLQVSYADNHQALARAMRSYEGTCQVLLQTYQPGTGHGVELLMHRGRPLAAFQHRRLREVPVSGGASALRESVSLDQSLYQHAVRLLAELDWTGLAMVEFKVGPQGTKLMEINGRVWGSLPLAVRCGVDFPYLAAQLHLKGSAAGPMWDAPATWTDLRAAATTYRTGVRVRNLELDMLWIATVLAGRRRYPYLPFPKRRVAIGAIMQLLDPRCGFDVQTVGDPIPGLVDLARILAKLTGRVSFGRAEQWAT
jgi:biotin carboxylase